ncbi:MAG: hypothetical protein RLZZ623_310 [Actinomycetota bacterium]
MTPTHTPVRARPLLAAMTALLVLFGCSGSNSSSSPAVGPSTPTSASTPTVDGGATTAATTAETTAGTPPTPGSTPETFLANVTFGSGPGDITDTSAGLADLASYTATLTISFEGTNASGPSTWSSTAVMTAAQEPAVRQLIVTTSGDLPGPTPLFRAETAGATFEKRGDESCVADVIGADPEAAPLVGPAAALSVVLGADAAGSETVNGTAADHYTFDQQAILHADGSTSTGEAWVATNGGYIVKYLLQTKAGAELFGDGIDGTITWDYELTGVDQPVALAMPEDCPAGLVDAPQLPDAANVENLPGLLSYDTSTPMADVVAFYQSELANRGWTASDDPTIDDTSATMYFTQGAATLGVTASVDGSTTSVQVFST